MKKILYAILSPFILVVLYFYSKDEMVDEFEDFHNERNEMLSNGTWTEEDEKEYQDFRADIIKDYGKRTIKHLA